MEKRWSTVSHDDRSGSLGFLLAQCKNGFLFYSVVVGLFSDAACLCFWITKWLWEIGLTELGFSIIHVNVSFMSWRQDWTDVVSRQKTKRMLCRRWMSTLHLEPSKRIQKSSNKRSKTCKAEFWIVSFLGCQIQSSHVNWCKDNLNALIGRLKGAAVSSGVSRSGSGLQLSSFCTFRGAAFSHLFSHHYSSFFLFFPSNPSVRQASLTLLIRGRAPCSLLVSRWESGC